MDTLISVIAPVYNMEKYLKKCIESILEQTWKNLELILVDDGSTDASGKICDEFASSDARIKVFHKNNDGPSSAKNFGLEKANGDYVIFINSDDFWTCDNALEQLIDIAVKFDADLVKGEYQYVQEDGKFIRHHKMYMHSSEVIISPEKMLRHGFAGDFSFFLTLIRKNKLKGLTFDESFSFDEDTELFARLFCKPLRCAYTNMVFYGYRIHEKTIRASFKLSNLQCSFSLADTFARCASTLRGALRHEYRRQSVSMYYRGLQIMSQGAYWNKRNSIIQTLELGKLQKKTARRIMKWMIIDRHLVPNIVSPAIGVALVRFRNKLEGPVHAISKSRKLSKKVYLQDK